VSHLGLKIGVTERIEIAIRGGYLSCVGFCTKLPFTSIPALCQVSKVELKIDELSFPDNDNISSVGSTKVVSTRMAS
jgi:hypothetical protein